VRELTVALASLDAERRPLHGSPHTANWFPDRGRPSAARLRDRAPRARRMGPSRPRRGGTRLLSRRRPRRDYHHVPNAQRVRRRQVLGRAPTSTRAPRRRARPSQTAPRAEAGLIARTGGTPADLALAEDAHPTNRDRNPTSRLEPARSRSAERCAPGRLGVLRPLRARVGPPARPLHLALATTSLGCTRNLGRARWRWHATTRLRDHRAVQHAPGKPLTAPRSRSPEPLQG
jgi:hypothetical protein